MSRKGGKHIVVVEAYQGHLEFLSDEPEEWKSAQGLGLPLEDFAETLDCRFTVLCWDDWLRYELSYGSPFVWVPNPVTRPASPSAFAEAPSVFQSDRVRRIPVPARDPVFRRPFSETGLSPRSHGQIANNDLMFFVSNCLKEELLTLYRADPFHAVILPVWGGLGYLFQLARATGSEPSADVPCIAIATGTSAGRQLANQEGYWTTEAAIRRQMEDTSLALADAVLAFGPLGMSFASQGRLSDGPPAMLVPRRVSAIDLDRVADAAEKETGGTTAFFYYEPQQPAAGALVLLDSVALLARRNVPLERPVISAGPPMVFAPMNPLDFQAYWSTRGFVRELTDQHRWHWQRERPRLEGGYPIRLYPSLFEHLPNVFEEIARGSLVLLSPASAEGLAPGEILPPELVIDGNPTPSLLGDAIQALAALKAPALERLRRKICRSVVAAHRGALHQRHMEQTTEFLRRIIDTPPRPQPLGCVARMFLDRHRSMREISSEWSAKPQAPVCRARAGKTLSVVVNCYEMGSMVTEAVESVWASDHVPEEVLLIDDGSRDPVTLAEIGELERVASERNMPLRVIRQNNLGLASARNVGLTAARGDYISFLDGDDRIDPRFYRMALQLLSRYPELGGVAAWAYCFNEHGTVGYWNGWQPELPSSFTDNVVIVPCVTPTGLLRSLGGYDIRQRYNYEDWELSLRMLIRGWPIVLIPDYLMNYRERSDSLYRSMTEVQNQVMRERLYATHRENMSRFAPEIALRLENRLYRLRKIGERTTSTKEVPPWAERLSDAALAAVRYLRRRTTAKT